MNGWHRDGMETRLTLTLSPTLCAMLRDPLLQERYARHLDSLIELAEKELHRTHWEPRLPGTRGMYHQRFTAARDTYLASDGDVVGAFRRFQDLGKLEIITTAATHALLPLHGQPSAIRPRANSHRARSLPGMFRLRPARHLAAGVRLLRGRGSHSCRRRISAGSSWTRMACCTPNRVRATACSRPSSRPTASPPSGATSNPRARSGAARGLSRRRALSRFLPRHRLRSGFRLREAASALAGPSRLHRPEVLSHHRRPGGEADLPAPRGVAGGGRSRRAFSQGAHGANPATRRHPGPPAARARAVRCGVVRALVV